MSKIVIDPGTAVTFIFIVIFFTIMELYRIGFFQFINELLIAIFPKKKVMHTSLRRYFGRKY